MQITESAYTPALEAFAIAPPLPIWWRCCNSREVGMTAQPAKYALEQRVHVEAPGIVAEGEIRSRFVEPGTDIWCYGVALDNGQQTVLYETYLSPAIRWREFI